MPSPGLVTRSGKHPGVPVTPEQIAQAAIDAAKAGATAAHLHVRDPATGKGSRDPELFKRAVDIVRSSGTDVVINLTAGMGGDWMISEDDPCKPGPGTDMIGPEERLRHVEMLRPEICSLDCGSMNFGDGNYVYMSTPPYLRRMAALVKEWGVKPELEVFDLGHIRLAKQLIAEGLIEDPPMFQICLGIPWGADQSVDNMKAMKDQLPANASWASFGISRMQMPMAAAAVAMGGNVRVGPRGQSLSRPRRAGEQCPARRARRRHRRAHGRAGADAGRGAQEARAQEAGMTAGPSGIGVVFQNVTKQYGKMTAVDGVSLDIRAGEFLTLLGPSGSGKTTLLMMLAGFQDITAGDILRRRQLDCRDAAGEAQFRHGVPGLCAVPAHDGRARTSPIRWKSAASRRPRSTARVNEMLDLVQLKGFADRYPHQLSGGQQQRVALARALSFSPRVLLLDEPLGALDRKLRADVQEQLKDIHNRVGTTFIYVTHDQEEALTMSDRIVIMNRGKVVQVGNPVELYERPRTAFAASFLGKSNFIHRDGRTFALRPEKIDVFAGGHRATARTG